MSEDSTEEKKELTFGEKACGVSFNPGGDPMVTTVKAAFAALVDQLNDLREASVNPDKKRHYSLAITYLEDAQMRAVKAVTWK